MATVTALAMSADFQRLLRVSADFRLRRKATGTDIKLCKPEEIREKIVGGRMEKFVKERALLEQEYVKDSSMTVEDRLKAAIAKLGENMKINRFSKFELGS